MRGEEFQINEKQKVKVVSYPIVLVGYWKMKFRNVFVLILFNFNEVYLEMGSRASKANSNEDTASKLSFSNMSLEYWNMKSSLPASQIRDNFSSHTKKPSKFALNIIKQ